MLEWVVDRNPSWKVKYLMGLNLIGRSQILKGIQIFKDLGKILTIIYFTT